jgi:hypothetical protein
LTVCAGGIVALAAGLFCTMASSSQLAMASRTLFILAAIGAVVATVVIGLLFRGFRPRWDNGNRDDPPGSSGPLGPVDEFDRELRELLEQEGALQ